MRLAESVKQLELKHVVITMVARSGSLATWKSAATSWRRGSSSYWTIDHESSRVEESAVAELES